MFYTEKELPRIFSKLLGRDTSLLVNHGRSLYEVQKLLGHADISTTQRYAHLSQDTLKDATEIVSLSLTSDGMVGDEQS